MAHKFDGSIFNKDPMLSTFDSKKSPPIARFNAVATQYPDVSHISDEGIHTSASVGMALLVMASIAGFATVGAALAGAFVHPDFYFLAAITAFVAGVGAAFGTIFSAMRI